MCVYNNHFAETNTTLKINYTTIKLKNKLLKSCAFQTSLHS